MASEQIEKIIREFTKLLRAYFQLQADAMGLEIIIRASVQTKAPISELWLELLNHIRTTQQYQKISEQEVGDECCLAAIADTVYATDRRSGAPWGGTRPAWLL